MLEIYASRNIGIDICANQTRFTGLSLLVEPCPVGMVNIHEAKTHLSRLVERAARGETIVIAKAGRPMVKLVPISAEAPREARRIGFLKGAFKVPRDFDRMGAQEIEALFGDRG